MESPQNQSPTKLQRLQAWYQHLRDTGLLLTVLPGLILLVIGLITIVVSILITGKTNNAVELAAVQLIEKQTGINLEPLLSDDK